MLLGKPVIGANSGATKEIITNHETGLLYDAGSKAGLVNALTFLVNNRADTKKMGRQAQLFATRSFNHASFEDRILPLIMKFKKAQVYPLVDTFTNYIANLEQTIDTNIKDAQAQEQTINALHYELKLKEETLADITNARAWKLARGIQNSSKFVHSSLPHKNRRTKPKS